MTLFHVYAEIFLWLTDQCNLSTFEFLKIGVNLQTNFITKIKTKGSQNKFYVYVDILFVSLNKVFFFNF
jgi:hypothetical protein